MLRPLFAAVAVLLLAHTALADKAPVGASLLATGSAAAVEESRASSLLQGEAVAKSDGKARAALSRFLDGVQTFEASFTQVQTDDRGRAEPPSVGQMALSRPGKFRWEYQAPNKQLIVTDGSTLWLYDEDIKQVTIRPAAEALQGTPAALLSQKKTLTDAFSVDEDGKEGEITKLKLVPKSKESDFKDVSLWLNASGAPVRMIFRDQLGGNTDISFSAVKTNGRVSGRQFAFSPPKGVEVITQ